LARTDLLQEGVLFNCSARIEKEDDGSLAPKGNCTEQGLIRYLMGIEGNKACDLIKQKEDHIL